MERGRKCKEKLKVRKINSESNSCISSLIVNFSDDNVRPRVQIKWKKSLSTISNYSRDIDDEEGFSENKRFVPVPYIFRMPITVDSAQIKNACALSPPFHLHLDHTLAVIWCLFSKRPSERAFGIVQLQWALYFLKGVYNDKGQHPKDVDLCIQIIQDKLIEKYAEMADEIDFNRISKDSSQSVCYCSKSSSESYFSYSDLEKKSSFSVNYADMTKSSSHVMAQKNKTVQDLIKIKANANPTTISESALKSSSSTNKVMGLLKTWHKEQIGRINAEMKKLHGLEDLMERVDVENTKPSRYGDGTTPRIEH